MTKVYNGVPVPPMEITKPTHFAVDGTYYQTSDYVFGPVGSQWYLTTWLRVNGDWEYIGSETSQTIQMVIAGSPAQCNAPVYVQQRVPIVAHNQVPIRTVEVVKEVPEVPTIFKCDYHQEEPKRIIFSTNRRFSFVS